MSTCISREGEYSEHETTEGNFICDRCGVLDEDGLFAERDALRAEVERLRMSPWDVAHRECDRLVARRWREDRDALRAAEARVAELEATVARVRALDDTCTSQCEHEQVIALCDLRAALAAPDDAP